MKLTRDRAFLILRSYFGKPRKDVQYLAGFKTPAGRVLALSKRADDVRIWFLPPEPEAVEGLTLIAHAKDDNLNGDWKKLNETGAFRVEIATEEALRFFAEWYGGKVFKPT